MTARDEVQVEIQVMVTALLEAGYVSPQILVRKAVDMVVEAIKVERRPIALGEMQQVAALFFLAAELQLVLEAGSEPAT